MKNLIRKVLYEQVVSNEIKTGFVKFYQLFKEKYGKTKDFNLIFNELISDINKSPTPKISITNSRQVCGASLTNNVIISSDMFDLLLYKFIYVLFHEIAHQYQYKKYGKSLIFDLNKNGFNEGVLDRIIEIEKVADRFGRSMSKKYSEKFKIPNYTIFSPYDGAAYTGRAAYRIMLQEIADDIKSGKITCIEQMEDETFRYFNDLQS